MSAWLPARRRCDAPTREPLLHLGDLALLFHDDAFGHLPRPRVFGMAKGNPRHVDCALVVRDHLDAEIHVRVARVGHGHAPHHARMRDLILGNGRRRGSGSAVAGSTKAVEATLTPLRAMGTRRMSAGDRAILTRAAGEGDHAKHGGGGDHAHRGGALRD